MERLPQTHLKVSTALTLNHSHNTPGASVLISMVKLIKSVCRSQRAAKIKPEMKQRSDESVKIEGFFCSCCRIVVCRELQFKDPFPPPYLSTPA